MRIMGANRAASAALVAVVTGASGVIGSAIALALAEEGLSLILGGRDGRRLEAVAATARKSVPRVETFLGDLTASDEVARLGQLAATFGHVDMLVNCMGSYVSREIEQATVEELDRIYSINLRAPFAVAKVLMPLLRASQGQIVFVNSGVALPRHEGTGLYAATKHGLRALTDALREEVHRDGVRVLNVILSRAHSPEQESLLRMHGLPYESRRMAMPEDIASAIVGTLRLPRTAEVTELSIRPGPGHHGSRAADRGRES